MAIDKTTLWHAFASGSDWGTPQSELAQGGEKTAGYYEGRTQDFYDYVIGPMWGYDDPDTSGEDKFSEMFGGEGEPKYFASLDTYELERAEREFRTEIGDPYGGGGTDPFAWERISQYSATSADAGVGEAQLLLEGELYGEGAQLGGDIGGEYGIGMSKGLEDYTTGIKGEREGLTYGTLTSGVGLQSGASGAVLRSGTATAQAEDILAEAGKGVKELGAGYTETKEGIELELGVDLTQALKVYRDAIEGEKESWYQNILSDVRRIAGTQDYELSDEELLFQADREAFDEADWEGLTYAGVEAEWGEDRPELGTACGIGEIYTEDENGDPSCQPIGDLEKWGTELMAPDIQEVTELCGGKQCDELEYLDPNDCECKTTDSTVTTNENGIITDENGNCYNILGQMITCPDDDDTQNKNKCLDSSGMPLLCRENQVIGTDCQCHEKTVPIINPPEYDPTKKEGDKWL